MRYFNTTGPCFPNEHYMLPPQDRCRGLMPLIQRGQYFVVHAARQSGKSTLLLELMDQLNQSGEYHALYCSVESAYGIKEVEKGIPAVFRSLRKQLRFHPVLSQYSFGREVDYADYNTLLHSSLADLCQQLDKPLVILFDEVDCLFNGTLVSFLRQLREGYINRGHIPFVQAVALVGMRNIRDFKARVRDERDTMGSSSPFNIAKVSKTLRNFYQTEVADLYAQHTAETGQVFPPEVVEAVFHYTNGQPWLVNAIASEIVEEMHEFDHSQPITVAHVEQAVETLIKRRDTHIDSLMERLKELRVQRFVEPVILGNDTHQVLRDLDDDYRYVLDLGLLREENKRLVPANPIYGEVMLRVLSQSSQMAMEQTRYPPTAPAYLQEDGRLDMRRLLEDFQQFWRENSEIWVKRYQYQEAALHLVLQAFLQRVINSGGRIIREMAAGSGRLDLAVHYGGHVYPIELKIRYKKKTAADGRQQIAEYMDTLGCSEGWLVIFDRRTTVSWAEKLSWQTDQVAGKTVHTVGYCVSRGKQGNLCSTYIN